MPPPGRKRTRPEADGGASSSHRRARLGDDDSADADASSMLLDEANADDGGEGGEGGDGGQAGAGAGHVPAGYNDGNRAFLQALMAHGALTFRHAQHVVAAVQNVERGADNASLLAPEDITENDVRRYVSRAKAALAPLDFDVRTAVDERHGERDHKNNRPEQLWVLTSTDPDPRAHLAVLFAPRKLAFVHRLLVALFDTLNTPRMEALCVTEQQALRLSRPPREAREDGLAGAAGAAGAADKGLKHSVVLALLASLVRQDWLARSTSDTLFGGTGSAGGFYSLTTRALLELEPFLVATFNDPDAPPSTGANAWQRIKYCSACRELVTKGLRCGTPTCMLRLHDRCEEPFWRTQVAARRRNRRGRDDAGGDTRPTCPHCHEPWGKYEDAEGNVAGKLHFIGERAITTTDVYRRRLREGRPTEGVDELMRQLLPRAAGGGGRGRKSGGAGSAGSALSGPFGQASSARSQHAEEEEEEEAEDE